MGKTYTVMETSARLFELGKYPRMPNPQTIADWIRAGRLDGEKGPGSGKDGQWKITEESIDAFVAPKLGPPFQKKGESDVEENRMDGSSKDRV